MRYLKTFELYNTSTGNYVDYKEGDIVVCDEPTSNLFLVKDKKYKVLRIYTSIEYKMMGKPYLIVDVEDVETGEISKGWESTRFHAIVEFDVDKYNF
jgi:hypothetical protein